MAKPPNAVILSEAKNLLFFFSSQKKSKEEILRLTASGRHGKVSLQKF